MSITALLVIAIFVVLGLIGLIKGFLKKIFTVATLVACFFIAGALTVPISDWAINNTKLSASIEEAVYPIIEQSAANDPVLSSEEATHVLGEAELSFMTSNPDSVIETVNKYTDSLSLPANFKKEMTLSQEDVRSALLEPGITIRSMVIKAAAKRLAGHIVKIIVYLSVCLAVYIAMRIVFAVLKFTGRIKVLSAGNHIAGMFIGLGEGLLVVWVFMMFVTMINPLPAGRAAMTQIGENPVLKALYDSNLLWNFVHI